MGCNCGRKTPARVERPQTQQYKSAVSTNATTPFVAPKPTGAASFQRFDRTDNNTYPYRIKK